MAITSAMQSTGIASSGAFRSPPGDRPVTSSACPRKENFEGVDELEVVAHAKRLERLQLPDSERLLLLGDFNVEGQGLVDHLAVSTDTLTATWKKENKYSKVGAKALEQGSWLRKRSAKGLAAMDVGKRGAREREDDGRKKRRKVSRPTPREWNGSSTEKGRSKDGIRRQFSRGYRYPMQPADDAPQCESNLEPSLPHGHPAGIAKGLSLFSTGHSVLEDEVVCASRQWESSRSEENLL
ncbi:hypothetical protein B0H13DRAFT_1850984 [Mycena leptocephala]|nr:hypothetical protein B0H13DRAFT_1850984 [Mycena leptocephala]